MSSACWTSVFLICDAPPSDCFSALAGLGLITALGTAGYVAVADFLEIARPRFGEAVDLEEVRVDNGSSLVGESIAGVEAHASGVRVVALKRDDEPIQLVPGGEPPRSEAATTSW